MCRTTGRATPCAALTLLVLSTTSRVLAQAGDEVIADPELAGPSSGAGSRSADGDEEIVDPELGGGKRPASTSAPVSDNGWGMEAAAEFNGGPREAPAPAAEEDTYDPMANTGLAKIEVVGQQGIDIHRENYLEDFFESRLRFGAETDFRISRKLRLSTGARLDFFYAAPNPNDSDLKKGQNARDVDRYEVDIIPLSAYVDYTVADGVHVRAGVQPISLGRMDFFSPTDMLVVYDLRGSPKADPSSMKLAQAALKMDWDVSSWATLQLAYIPWFMPHFSRPNQDRFVGAATAGIGASRQENPYQWMLSPSNQPLFTQSTLRLAGPAPDFTHPQAEARLNMRGSGFEIAALGGTAVEKTPFVYYAPEVARYLAYGSYANDSGDGNPNKPNYEVYNTTQLNIASQVGGKPPQPVIDVAYPRYYLLGLDGSFDIAPISIGFEAAYSPSRNLYTTSRDGNMPALPNVSHEIVDPGTLLRDSSGNEVPDKNNTSTLSPYTARDHAIRKGVPVIQGALHVEWISEDKFALVAEAYIIQATQMPYDRSRDWLGFIKGTGTSAAGILGGSYRFGADRWRVSASAVLTPGISIIAMPSVEVRVSDSLYANVGIQIYEGPAPGNIPLVMGRVPGTQAFPTNVTAGGVLSGYDQVTLGFRWLPGN